MGSSKGSTSTTSTQTSSPWGPIQGPLIKSFDEAERLYDAPGPQYFPDSTLAGFTPEMQQSLASIFDQTQAGSPIAREGQQQFQDTLSGKYLDPDTNPFLQSTIDYATQPIKREFKETTLPNLNSTFSRGGRYGSGAHARGYSQVTDDYQRNLGGTASNIAFANYGQERGRQFDATKMAPDYAMRRFDDPTMAYRYGGLQQIQNQRGIDAQRERFQYGQQLPYAKLAQYQQSLAPGTGFGTQTGQGTQPFFQDNTGKYIGYGILGASVIAAPFTGGASLAAAPAGASLAAGGGGGGKKEEKGKKEKKEKKERRKRKKKEEEEKKRD